MGSWPRRNRSRIGTWNIQSLGNSGTNEWNRELDVIARMGCEIVTIQEIDDLSEAIAFSSFAAAAGYSHFAVGNASGTLSGSLRNGVLSMHPIVSFSSHNSVSLSGDANANDITRDIFEARIQVPNAADLLGVFSVHFKASSGGTNDFRRAVEVHRLAQAIDGFVAANPGAPWVVTGDFNEDLGDGPFGNSFSSLPSGLPQTYDLGNDISFPVIYNPFVDLVNKGGLIADATQEDSATIDATRDSSGRRLDYLIYANGVLLSGDEVYNSARDNGTMTTRRETS